MTHQSPIRKRYVSTSKGDLHLRECGEGEPLVLLQSLTRSGSMYEHVLPRFASAGFRAIAIDLMGYGRSDARDGEWLVEDFAANLIEGFAALKIAPRIIAGGHFTAMIAAEIALDDSQCIERMVLDGVPVWEEALRKQMQSAVPTDSALWDEAGQAAAALWSQNWQQLQRLDPGARLTPETENAVLEIFMESVAVSRKPGPVAGFFNYPLIDKLPMLNLPVLLLQSETDTLASRHEDAARLLPNCTIHDFRGVHPLYRLLPSGDLDSYADPIIAFAAELESKA